MGGVSLCPALWRKIIQINVLAALMRHIIGSMIVRRQTGES